MSEWKAIDSAPKDGTAVLVHECGYVTIAFWHQGIRQWMGPRDNYGDADYMSPDAWMPLPPPPSTT